MSPLRDSTRKRKVSEDSSNTSSVRTLSASLPQISTSSFSSLSSASASHAACPFGVSLSSAPPLSFEATQAASSSSILFSSTDASGAAAATPSLPIYLRSLRSGAEQRVTSRHSFPLEGLVATSTVHTPQGVAYTDFSTAAEDAGVVVSPSPSLLEAPVKRACRAVSPGKRFKMNPLHTRISTLPQPTTSSASGIYDTAKNYLFAEATALPPLSSTTTMTPPPTKTHKIAHNTTNTQEISKENRKQRNATTHTDNSSSNNNHNNNSNNSNNNTSNTNNSNTNNSHSPSSNNNNSNQNLPSSPSLPPPLVPYVSPSERWEGLPKRELVSLLLQCLDGLDYKETFHVLERESGIALEHASIKRFREAIVSGDWINCFEIIYQLVLEPCVVNAMTFLVLEQKFLELMYHQKIEEAVECLRGEFQDACFDIETTNRLKTCCSFLMCQNVEDLQKRSQWNYEGSRFILWSRLQQLFPPDLVPPPKRLNTLIHQAWKYQELHCLYHTHAVDKTYPLLLDHACPKGGIPKHKISVLDRHTDEVWDVAVSNSAKYIASASKDRTIILWDAVPPYKKLMTWADHSAPVGCVSWSPDDRWLASASNDCNIIIWSPTSPSYKWKFSHHKSCVVSVCWLPDSRHLVSAEVEKELYLWKLCFPYNTHELVHEWDFGCRLQDCVVTSSGKFAVLVATDDTLRVIDLESKKEVWCLPETDSITSICASTLCDQILVNVCDPKTEITLWDLNMKHIVQKYVGHQQRLFAVRSAFGGPNESFVLCGCEDNQVYIWQRYRGSLLEIISGHTGTVNAVIWPCKTDFSLMISASDDHTLVLWHFDEHFKENFLMNGKDVNVSNAALKNTESTENGAHVTD